MYLELSETHRLLQESLARYLAAKSNTVPVLDRGMPRDRLLWQGLADELGLLGAALPEVAGGHGGGMVTNAVIMEEMGSALICEPYVTSIVLAGGILARSGSAVAADLLTGVIAGGTEIAVALSEAAARDELDFDPAFVATTATRDGDGYRIDGRKTVARWVPSADWLIVSARLEDQQAGLFLVSAAAGGLTRRDYATLDRAGAADLVLENVVVPAANLLIGPAEASAILQDLLDEATVAVCAEAVGAMRRMMLLTTGHARERRQFGVAIGSFQALQHLMVDMAVAVEQADAVTCAAVMALDRQAPDARALASAAKVQVGKACRLVGQGAIQVHGGMGIADETPIGRYFKRTTVIEAEFGSASQHLRRYARLRTGAQPDPKESSE